MFISGFCGSADVERQFRHSLEQMLLSLTELRAFEEHSDSYPGVSATDKGYFDNCKKKLQLQDQFCILLVLLHCPLGGIPPSSKAGNTEPQHTHSTYKVYIRPQGFIYPCASSLDSCALSFTFHSSSIPARLCCGISHNHKRRNWTLHSVLLIETPRLKLEVSYNYFISRLL